MIHPDQFIHGYSILGNQFRKASLIKELKIEDKPLITSVLADVIENSCLYNPWFTPSFVRFAFSAWADALQEENVERWITKYATESINKKVPVTVAIIMAGNIPMVGLHDLLCVLASGNHALIRLSSADDRLIPVVLDVLCDSIPELKDRFTIVEGPMKNFDAVIATGSNNTSRYFEYYFGRYPHIIRKNRNSAALITGHETDDDLRKLADDIFIYFGLGCRNVSKLYIPEGFRIEEVIPFFDHYAYLADMHKYRNNYDYQKSLLLINRVPHLDNGFLLLKEDKSLISPISVLHTETYQSVGSLKNELFSLQDQIQCIISVSNEINSAIPPGRSQFPELWDYADNADTMEFLMNLRKIN